LLGIRGKRKRANQPQPIIPLAKNPINEHRMRSQIKFDKETHPQRLNEKMEPCAIGEVGEMWAGGECVSTGYIGNEALTNERYVPDPFLGNGRLMFRTRDLGRWTADGELEHYGRTDDQVKVRGFRVELDSVSAALESVANCKRAVTLKLDARHLVGFASPLSVDVDEAKQAVADALPYYCTPKFVIALEELPMTPRGKIDKRLLLQTAVSHDKKSKTTVKEVM
ncbi:MAG: amino acid adenylation domain-containing protein, partial [Chloroflexi bacterium]|nr:amino acid adenylation domain-containing protein [Chloroflexota bacterium]